MKVAIIHYWLVGMRGGEKVLEALSRLFPEATIFTHAYNPSFTSAQLRSHEIRLTRVGRLPFSKDLYQQYLPFMPRALEEIDLSGYDLVISSESGPAKGVIVPPGTPHVCYCHSPMRYLWDQYHSYRDSAGPLTKLIMPHLAHSLRQWDVTSAARVDTFVANSSHVANRIEKYWRRESTIIHPPVQVSDFSPYGKAPEDFYLWAGELAPYKKPEIAIEAFRKLGKKLVVIGGPEKKMKRLMSTAGDNITFLGHASSETLRDYMARCKALVFPGEEDFGIVPVEVMASGRPVIAFGRGGILDTVVDRETGLFFFEQTADGLANAVETFESLGLDQIEPDRLISHAHKFSEESFASRFMELVSDLGIAVPNEYHGEPSGPSS